MQRLTQRQVGGTFEMSRNRSSARMVFAPKRRLARRRRLANESSGRRQEQRTEERRHESTGQFPKAPPARGATVSPRPPELGPQSLARRKPGLPFPYNQRLLSDRRPNAAKHPKSEAGKTLPADMIGNHRAPAALHMQRRGHSHSGRGSFRALEWWWSFGPALQRHRLPGSMGRRSDRTGADVDGERAGDAHFHVTDPEMPGCRRLLRFGHGRGPDDVIAAGDTRQRTVRCRLRVVAGKSRCRHESGREQGRKAGQAKHGSSHGRSIQAGGRSGHPGGDGSAGFGEVDSGA